MTTEQDTQPAMDVLAAAIEGADDATVCRVMAALDPSKIPHAVILWIGAAVEYADLTDSPHRMRTAWRTRDEGNGTHLTMSGSDVDSATEWSGLMFTAACNRDHQTMRDLINGVASNEEWTQNVYAVLFGAASVIRRAERGDPVVISSDAVDQ